MTATTAGGPAGRRPRPLSPHGSWLGSFVLVAFTWSLLLLMLGGVRHAIWDLGHAFGDVRYQLSWLTAIGSVSLTIILWVVIVVLEAL